MLKKLLFWSGIISVLLFTFTTIIGQVGYPNYNFISQFISELYAVDAPNANALRFYGYLPSGVFFILFALFLHASLPKSSSKTLGCFLFGLGYGFGTIICSIFNCDAGCNPNFVNPSLSQFIHNGMGMITYLIVPIGILSLGFSLRKNKTHVFACNFSALIAILSFLFVLLLNVNLHSPYKGLIQRIIEGSILFWVVFCAFTLSKKRSNTSEL